jgi:hypothetical protein
MGEDDEIVLVDNASKDATAHLIRRIEKVDKRVKGVINTENLGFSEGCNVGIRVTAKEFVLLLNPDTVVTAGFLDRLRAPFADPTVGATGPITDQVAHLQQHTRHVPTHLDGSFTIDTFAHYVAKRNEGTTLEAKILVGFCILLKREILDEIGLLDKDLFLGCDDFDLSWRLRLANYRLLIVRSAYIHHAHHASFNSEPESVTAPLVQEAFDKLARKLILHYGEGNVPTEEELWGIRDGFHPSFDLWPNRVVSTQPRRLVIGGQADDALTLGWNHAEEYDAQIDPAEPLPVGQTLQTRRFGPITLEPGMFEEIVAYHLLEHSRDVLAVMTSLKDLLVDWGRLLVRTTHPMAPEAWSGQGFTNIFGQGAFDVFCEQPDLVGWSDVRLDHIKHDSTTTDYGWQLAANNGVDLKSVLWLPRTMKFVDDIFEKRPERTKPAPTPPPQQPALTLLLATYKRKALAMRAIDYALNHSIRFIELLIIGDNCPDFEELLHDRYFQAKLELARSRGMAIRTLNLPDNHGTPHEIINTAIKMATGPYLIFSADDDITTMHHCENYFRAIEGTDCDLVLMDTLLVGDYYTTTRVPKMEVQHAGHSEIIVRTEAARTAPPHKASATHDWDFICAIAQNGKWKRVECQPTYYVNLTTRVKHFKVA